MNLEGCCLALAWLFYGNLDRVRAVCVQAVLLSTVGKPTARSVGVAGPPVGIIGFFAPALAEKVEERFHRLGAGIAQFIR